MISDVVLTDYTCIMHCMYIHYHAYSAYEIFDAGRLFLKDQLHLIKFIFENLR